MLTLLYLLACAPGEAPSDASSGPPPALVRVASVEPGDLDDSWAAVAEVRSLGAAELAAGAAGAVTHLVVREGDAVERGALLLEVDSALARARAATAAASVTQAELELERLRGALARRERVSDQVISAEALADARAAVAIQEARLAALRGGAAEAAAAVALHQVRAPFAGVVTARSVDPGDWVTAGQPVLDLLSSEGLEVRVRVPQALARRLAEGDVVSLEGGEGTIERVVPALDPQTRTALVRIRPGEGLGLSPGQAVELRLPVSWRGVGVKIPRDALLLDPEHARVLAVSDNTARAVEVEVLATTAESALVVAEGLSVGDQVITRGNERARAGAPVRIEGSNP